MTSQNCNIVHYLSCSAGLTFYLSRPYIGGNLRGTSLNYLMGVGTRTTVAAIGTGNTLLY